MWISLCLKLEIMSNSANKKGQVAMLDTSFLIRLLNKEDLLHKSAVEFFQYLLEQKYVLYVSTIALAEYCVKGKLDEIPFENIRVVPFNLDHSSTAGAFAATLYEAKKRKEFSPESRLIIPNDTKIFAQAAKLNAVYVVTSDTGAGKAMQTLSGKGIFTVQHLDIHKSVSEAFGMLLYTDAEV